MQRRVLTWTTAGKSEGGARHQLFMTVDHLPDQASGQPQGPAPGCRRDGPPLDVRSWRLCRLLEAGFPAETAQRVAADRRFDLHVLLELVDRGCPPVLAVRITEPIDPLAPVAPETGAP